MTGRCSRCGLDLTTAGCPECDHNIVYKAEGDSMTLVNPTELASQNRILLEQLSYYTKLASQNQIKWLAAKKQLAVCREALETSTRHWKSYIEEREMDDLENINHHEANYCKSALQALAQIRKEEG